MGLQVRETGWGLVMQEGVRCSWQVDRVAEIVEVDGQIMLAKSEESLF